MPEARRSGFTEKIYGGEESKAAAGKGPAHEWGLGAQASTLRIWDKSGRLAAGFSWASYVTDRWEDAGNDGLEKLTLVFVQRYAIVWGHHLLELVRGIDEGQLKSITELDSAGARALAAENLSVRDPQQQRAIVTRYEVGPDIEDLVAALKGDEKDEARNTRRAK